MTHRMCNRHDPMHYLWFFLSSGGFKQIIDIFQVDMWKPQMCIWIFKVGVLYIYWDRVYLPIKTSPTRMGFEPTRAEPNGLAVHRLNHSATSSHLVSYNYDCSIFDANDVKHKVKWHYHCVGELWSPFEICIPQQPPQKLSVTGGTRTHSLRIRSPTRYPLRHGDQLVLW